MTGVAALDETDLDLRMRAGHDTLLDQTARPTLDRRCGAVHPDIRARDAAMSALNG